MLANELAGRITAEIVQGVATLVIDNPGRRNAIDAAMWRQLDKVLAELAEDSDVRVLVLRGAGERAFSTGADISELAELVAHPEQLAENNRLIQQAQARLESFPRPTIALIHGACVGGGCGLALACDYRLAADNARFGITPARLGLLYSERDTRRLHRLVGPAHCREILFGGDLFDGARAMQIGMLNQLLPTSELQTACDTLAGKLASASRYALHGIKATLASIEGYGAHTPEQLQQLFDGAFTAEDCREGAAAFLEKRAAKFT
ncbi:enoyl-CoA hydratase/isomerase family protein [Microbulbifer sp. ALW1]|uniref:enoyl-CoA hydratase/isomerase family protein n=1 Tax=Microbulbifer sp. (strain ALW1) TaxID=1516059 RepID=UPI001359FD98|nr:enoyl-CoA hydratase-related protein [Microbulbifer sp. ALW1]